MVRVMLNFANALTLVVAFGFWGASQASAQNFRQLCLTETGEKAINACSSLIRQNSTDAEAYHSRASEFARRGEDDRAIADYNEAIRLNPDYSLAYYNRGLALENKGQLKQALADFKAAAELSPTEADTKKAISRVTTSMSNGTQEFSSSNRNKSTTGRIEALERLSKLRNSGALTKQEFEREKKRLLED